MSDSELYPAWEVVLVHSNSGEYHSHIGHRWLEGGALKVANQWNSAEEQFGLRAIARRTHQTSSGVAYERPQRPQSKRAERVAGAVVNSLGDLDCEVRNRTSNESFDVIRERIRAAGGDAWDSVPIARKVADEPLQVAGKTLSNEPSPSLFKVGDWVVPNTYWTKDQLGIQAIRVLGLDRSGWLFFMNKVRNGFFNPSEFRPATRDEIDAATKPIRRTVAITLPPLDQSLTVGEPKIWMNEDVRLVTAIFPIIRATS